jgi:hypothetical protein
MSFWWDGEEDSPQRTRQPPHFSSIRLSSSECRRLRRESFPSFFSSFLPLCPSRDHSTASRKGAALRSGGQGITGGGIRCQTAAEREVAEEKQIPRFAGDDKDGKRQEREIAPT